MKETKRVKESRERKIKKSIIIIIIGIAINIAVCCLLKGEQYRYIKLTVGGILVGYCFGFLQYCTSEENSDVEDKENDT